MRATDLDCVRIESPFGSAVGHCTLIEHGTGLTLIDAGIGLGETRNPEEKLGKELVERTGFLFDEGLTAVRQVEALGFDPSDVRDVVCSHLDPDHIGGLADFPDATVHVAEEELEAFEAGDERYLPRQLHHAPPIRTYAENDADWLGWPARSLDVPFEAYLVPLFGHTPGHCGVAFRAGARWTFYVGDAYYLRAELEHPEHPVSQLATLRATDDGRRRATLDRLREFLGVRPDDLDVFGYHDPTELG